MNQLDLFAAAPVMARPARPDTAMLLAMSGDHIRASEAPPIRRARSLITLDNFMAQETAKRAMEIAVAGGHGIYYEACAGPEYQWAMSDIHRMTGTARDRALSRAARFDGKAWSLAAAQHEATLARKIHERLVHLTGPKNDGRNCVMSVQMQPISLADFVLPPPIEPESYTLARIENARDLLPEAQSYQPQENAVVLMQRAAEVMKLTDMQQETIWLVARTISAMAGCGFLGRIHVAEALSYARECSQ